MMRGIPVQQALAPARSRRGRRRKALTGSDQTRLKDSKLLTRLRDSKLLA